MLVCTCFSNVRNHIKFCPAAIVQAASLPTIKVPIPSLEVILSLRVGTRLSSQDMGSSRAAMDSHLSKAHLLPTPLRETAHTHRLSTASRVHHRMITASKVLIVREHFTVVPFYYVFIHC